MKSLLYFWRTNLAVLAGIAVTTAVLTGALIVGDSVRASLQALTLDRLGSVEYAIVGERFFRSNLANELKGDLVSHSVPAVLLKGSVVAAETRARASRVHIYGIDQSFPGLFPDADTGTFAPLFNDAQSGPFPPILINEALQQDLHVQTGDALVLYFQRPSDIHRESLLGSRDPSDILQSARFTLSGILTDKGPGAFALEPNQNIPTIAFVPMNRLQSIIGQKGKANSILVGGILSTETSTRNSIHELLKHHVSLDDYELQFRTTDDTLILESKEVMLKPEVVRAATKAAEASGAQAQKIITYLANSMEISDRSIPYSTVTALDDSMWTDSGMKSPLILNDGTPAPDLNEGEIFLNEWAAQQLSAKPGDSVTMRYYVMGSGDQLLTEQSDFHLRGIVKMEGIAKDPSLSPEYPGIEDAVHISDWSPPFPVDLTRIRPQDEEYWDEFRATPKAFVSLSTATKLWTSRFGLYTSIRFRAESHSVPELQKNLSAGLLQNLSPEEMGISILPVKETGMKASAGATDFGMLFVGFSMFLIVSAALLAGLLFRLSAEQRAAEMGMLLATGYSPAMIRKRFLTEAAFLALSGALLGIALAGGYAWAMLEALRTRWISAVGSSQLYLHLFPSSLTMGYAISVLLALLVLWSALHTLVRVPAIRLLRKETSISGGGRKTLAKKIGIAALLLAAAMFVTNLLSNESSAGLFFGIGSCVLIAGLSFFSHYLRKTRTDAMNPETGTIGMSVRNSERNPGRSMLSAGLIACACFVIVAVGANRHEPGMEIFERNSGAGGYSLIARSDVPVHQDLNSKTGRFDLGLPDSTNDVLSNTDIQAFRLLPGEDVSCLNLYLPQRPQILGVPSSFIQKGGFLFQQTVKNAFENPWELLQKQIEPDVIPAIGDYNSVLWILHLGLGKDLAMQDQNGKEIRLRIVGLLQKSLFQGELLISDEMMKKHFPAVSGHSYFLMESSASKRDEVAAFLEEHLDRYGFDVQKTEDVLARYQAVENTYLATFQTLGGLGLLLGTLGLAIILIRNVMERRGELATLRAFGYQRSALTRMVLMENLYLLFFGISIGSISALIAVAPHIAQQGEIIPWGSLLETLVLVIAAGMISSIGAVFATLRIPLLPALKAE